MINRLSVGAFIQVFSRSPICTESVSKWCCVNTARRQRRRQRPLYSRAIYSDTREYVSTISENKHTHTHTLLSAKNERKSEVDAKKRSKEKLKKKLNKNWQAADDSTLAIYRFSFFFLRVVYGMQSYRTDSIQLISTNEMAKMQMNDDTYGKSKSTKNQQLIPQKITNIKNEKRRSKWRVAHRYNDMWILN